MTIDNPSDSIWAGWKTGLQQYLQKELFPLLADLRLAIFLLLIIAVFSISGTIIEQGESVEFYRANYPEQPALFGFLTWQVILGTGLDHVYRTWWFLAILILFGASLVTCTFRRQLPALSAARRWKFYSQPRQYEKLALSAALDSGSLQSLEGLLKEKRYRIFQEGDTLYARKGIMGRIGPILVHASMIVILLGAILGAMTGFFAQEMIPSGEQFRVQHIFDAGPWSGSQIPKDWSVRVNRFWIDYTPDGNIDQFYSDLSVLDDQEQEVKRKTIHVNEPLRYKNVTLYQADWAIAALRVKVNNSPILKLPMAQLDTGGQGRIWGAWVPTKPDLSEGVSVLARDLQGILLVYDTAGKLVATVREGMSTEVNGVTLAIAGIVGSTGLQIKADPGIPIVYAGFAFLMVGVMMSYVSHSQVWSLCEDGTLYVGGRTNRAQVAFERELVEILDQLAAQDPEATASINS